MAHNLNKTNGKTSFAAVGQKAWHGLGQYVNEAMTSQQAIDLGGLNYIVEKQKMITAAGIEVPDHFATVRKDTSAILGVVSDQYHIVQNHEAFLFFDSIIDSGEAVYQTAGALGKGEKIFITAKLPKDILVNGEQCENYLLLTSGHDGRSAIQAGFTSIRVVCNNTLTAALKGLQNKVSILHFKNVKDKLSAAAKVMGMASKYTVELETVFNNMAKVKITDSKLKDYIMQVMKPATEVITKEKLDKDYSALFMNKVNSIIDFAHTHPTQVTKEAKGTVWGAYNSISGYFSYLKNYSNQEEKMKDIYFNGAAGRVQDAFQLATAMI